MVKNDVLPILTILFLFLFLSDSDVAFQVMTRDSDVQFNLNRRLTSAVLDHRTIAMHGGFPNFFAAAAESACDSSASGNHAHPGGQQFSPGYPNGPQWEGMAAMYPYHPGRHQELLAGLPCELWGSAAVAAAAAAAGGVGTLVGTVSQNR